MTSVWERMLATEPGGEIWATEQVISIHFPRGSVQVLPLLSKDSKQDGKQMNRTQNA